MTLSGKPPPSKAAANDATASPPRKKNKKATVNEVVNGNVASTFGKQLTEEEEKCKYVTACAPLQEPRGVVWMQYQVKTTIATTERAIERQDYIEF